MMDSVMTRGETPRTIDREPSWLAELRERAVTARASLPEPGAKDPHWRNSPVERYADAEVPCREAERADAGTAQVGGAGHDDAALGGAPGTGKAAVVLGYVRGRIHEPFSAGGTFRPRPGLTLTTGPAALEGGPWAGLLRAIAFEDRHHARAWAEAGPLLGLDLAEGHDPGGLIVVDWADPVDGRYAAPVVAVRVREGARARLALRWRRDAGAGEAVSTLAPSVLVHLAQGASLEVFELVETGRGLRFLDHPLAVLGEGADLTWRRAFLAASLAKSRLTLRLEGRAARARVETAFVAGSGAHIDASVVQDHSGEATWSRTAYAGLADADGRAATHGLIRIAKSASGADAYLSSKSLSLGPEARTVSLPELEIDTNDLQASHGSTVGTVGPEELFYLGARGLDPATARALIAAGLVGPLLEAAPPELGLDVEALLEGALLEGKAGTP